MAYKKECECCGIEFTTSQSKAKYCSRPCQQKMYLARKKKNSLNEIYIITYPGGEKEELYLNYSTAIQMCEKRAERYNWKYMINNQTITFTELPKDESIKTDSLEKLQKGFNLTKEQALQARIIQLEYKLKGVEQMHENELVHLKAMHQAELKRKDQEIDKIREDKEAENTQKLISGIMSGRLFNNQMQDD